MSRRTSRSTSYTSGVNPVGPFRAKVVSFSGGLASIQIPRLGMNNVYDEVPYSGFVPTVGASVWAFFIEGNASHPMIVVSATDSDSDINAIVAGTNLNGGGTGGSVTVNLDDTIILSSVTADNFYGDVTGGLTGDVTGNLTGNVTGNVTGDVTGNVTGNVIGDVTADVTGNLTGNVTGDVTGNADTATALATPRDINDVSFDGTASITVTAAAGTLTGSTLNSGVTDSSLTSLGTLASLTVDGDATFDTSTLYVDSTNSRVGIGTTTPDTNLEVVGSVRASTSFLVGESGDDGIGPVTGTYGSVQTVGSGAGSYDGYSINGRAVFMHDGADRTGLYNDVDNQWILYSDNGAATTICYAGAARLTTSLTGASIEGDLTLNASLYSGGNLTVSGLSVSGAADFASTVDFNSTVDLNSNNLTNVNNIYAANGSNSFPSHTFTSNIQTGMYLVGTSQLGFTAGGTLGLTVTSTGTTISGNLTVSGTTDLTNSTLSNVLRLHVNEIYADVGGAGDPSYTFSSPNDNTGIYLKTTGQLGFSLSGSEQMYLTTSGLHMKSGDWFRSSGSAGWYNDTYAVGLYATQSTWVTAYGSGNVGFIAESTVGLLAPLNTTTTSGSLYIRRESTFGTLLTYSSTRELKENVQSIDPAESGRILDMLRPVTYIEKFRSGPDGSFVEGVADTSAETDDQYKLREWDVEYGFIAEELDALEPEGVKLASYDWQQVDDDGFPKPAGWKDSNVTAILVAEVKELRKRLAVLEQLQ